MFSLLFDSASQFVKRVFGRKKNTSRLRQAARTRLMLEPLEDRQLLSATGSEMLVPSELIEAGRYAAQEVRGYISNCESTVGIVQQTVENLKEQVLDTVSCAASLMRRMVQQFVQRNLLPTESASSPNVQPTSTEPGQSEEQQSNGHTASEKPIATQGSSLTNVDGQSPASGSGQPLAVNQAQSSQPQALNMGTSFTGIGADSYWPPDTNAAVGPNCVIEVVNQQIAIYDKTGNRLSSESLQNFFGITTFATDPVVSYDDQADRFVVCDDQLNQTTGDTKILLAVSNTSSPTNLSSDFTEKQSIDVTETNSSQQTLWADQPQLGWNADAYVISMNMYGLPTSSGSFDHVQLLTIQKSSVLDQNPSTLTDYRVDYADAFSLAPSRMHGSVTGDPMWFVQQWSQASPSYTGIDVVKMTNVLTPNPTFVDTYVPTLDYYGSYQASQPGGDGFDTDDPRINAPDWRNGTLVAAQAMALSDSDRTSKAHWTEISTSGATPTLVQQGTIDPGSGISAFYPSIAIDPNGDMGMTYLQSSSSQYLSMYVTGRASGDPTGTMETPIEVFAGQATYSNGADPQRAGDYSGTSVDPSSPNTFWVANEYAVTGNAPNWGTGIAEFSIPPSSSWTTVDLSSYYNVNGLTWGNTPITGNGIDGHGDALEGYYQFNWDGTNIGLGPVNANDVVSAKGQTINVNPNQGQYSTLTLFATAVNGNQTSQYVTVHYSSGPAQTVLRSFTNWLSAPQFYDEQQVMQTNAFKSDGSLLSNSAYFSAYALPLDPSRTVTSITLPNDPNVEILAMALYHDGATAQSVNLTSDYSRNGLTWGNTRITGSGIDGLGDALEGYYQFNWDGTNIPLGPVGANDVVSAPAQTININPNGGQYSTLTLFATAVNGNQTSQYVTVHYSSGPAQTVLRSFTNWLSAPQFYDEQQVMQTNAFKSDGSLLSNSAYFSAYALPLDPSRTVTSITLPNDSNVEILAMELT